MIGIVVVSHSARLAEGVCEIAAQVGKDGVRLAAAGGTGDPENPIGTDAFAVLHAIESVYSDDGVLVLMDLGSAVLSAETALDLLDESKRARVQLCSAPLVEGAVAAAALAAAGAGLGEVGREAAGALAGKTAHLATPGEVDSQDAAIVHSPAVERLATLPNRLGLHARPAAELVRIVRRFQARVTLHNRTSPAAADAASITALLSLGARHRHEIMVRAEGAEAGAAVAAVADFLNSGCGDRDGATAPPVAAREASQPGEVAGLPASSGIGVGPLLRLRPGSVTIPREPRDEPAAEERNLAAALREARERTLALSRSAKAQAPNEAGIFDAQLLFLEDPELTATARQLLYGERVSAAYAWRAATDRVARRLRTIDDPYLQARGADLEDVASRVLAILLGTGAPPAELQEPSIVAACDLTPSQVQSLDRDRLLGIALEMGSANAHSVILARAMGVPVVVGAGAALSSIADGTIVAIDGDRGTLTIAPDPDSVREWRSRQTSWRNARQTALAQRHEPARTRDGHTVRVFANISGMEESAEAVEFGAGGVGVLRTEFLFVGRNEPPSEEEQLAAYTRIADSLGGRPLVIRTLDIGGDKNVPYLDIGKEANPFLGWRGIRVTLGRPDLMRTQLRAILRAAHGRPIEILLPLISSSDELIAARTMLAEIEAELGRESLEFRRGLSPGVMIEAPSAVAISDHLARDAAFFSIGTNDLIQYLMVADRTNPRVALIADPFQPAVLRSIRQAVEAARAAGIETTLCGEFAADRLATSLLIGLGIHEFSVSAPLIPELKQAIRRTSRSSAEALAREALSLRSAQAVRALLAHG